MKLASATFTNVGIIPSLALDFPDGDEGCVIVLRGKNGTGKTTICRALQVMFDGGSYPDLIGPAGDEYAVEVILDNGDHFRRVENRKGYTLKGWRADGSIIKSPAKTLQSLASGLALEPTGLVDAPKKDRVQFLQAAMPLAFTAHEVAEITGDHPAKLPPVMDLERFTALRDGRYERRRNANVELRDKEATRQEWAKALPEGDPLRSSNAESAAAAFESPAAAEAQSLDIQLEQAKDGLREALSGWAADYDRLRDEIAENEAKEIEDIRREMEARMEAVRAAKKKERDDLYDKYVETVDAERKPLENTIADLTSKLAAAQERRAAEAKQQGIRDSIIKLDSEIRSKQDEANRLDVVVKKLDELKLQKINSQEIPGVEIRGQEIYYNGLNFDTQVNTARQYVLSFQVAALTLTEDALPFFLFDKAESLVGEQRELFIDGMKEAGFQVIMADADEAAEELQVLVA